MECDLTLEWGSETWRSGEVDLVETELDVGRSSVTDRQFECGLAFDGESQGLNGK